jgi:hypothetical protein
MRFVRTQVPERAEGHEIILRWSASWFGNVLMDSRAKNVWMYLRYLGWSRCREQNLDRCLPPSPVPATPIGSSTLTITTTEGGQSQTLSLSLNVIAPGQRIRTVLDDLQNNTVARYNFIAPNLCNDIRDCAITTGDALLASNLRIILNSTAYQQGGVDLVTWDEANTGDEPIGMIVLSPNGKGAGYQDTIHYTHVSKSRTIKEIMHVTPLLGMRTANGSQRFVCFVSHDPFVTLDVFMRKRADPKGSEGVEQMAVRQTLFAGKC